METERLKLKLITPEDAEFLQELMNTPKWHQMIGDRKVYSKEDAIKYMDDRMHEDLDKKGFVNHVLIEKATQKMVGTCSLHNRDGVQGLDIGYALLPDYEGKGYAAEGARAMTQLAFDEYNIDFVNAITTDENVGSCRVLERLGFKHKGYISLPGSTEKIKLYSLKKNEFIT